MYLGLHMRRCQGVVEKPPEQKVVGSSHGAWFWVFANYNDVDCELIVHKCVYVFDDPNLAFI
jgi:hypothetical protein